MSCLGLGFGLTGHTLGLLPASMPHCTLETSLMRCCDGYILTCCLAGGWWQLKERLESLKINKGEHYCADPSGMRDGNGCGPQLSETIEKVVTDAEKYVDKVSSRGS